MYLLICSEVSKMVGISRFDHSSDSHRSLFSSVSGNMTFDKASPRVNRKAVNNKIENYKIWIIFG